MIPGEYLFDGGPIELNAGRPTVTLEVNNTGDRPVQIGSHFHFFEVNRAVVFDREAAYGMRLDLPAGTAVRIEPGDVKPVRLVALGGQRRVYGGSAVVNGALDDPAIRQRALEVMRLLLDPATKEQTVQRLWGAGAGANGSQEGKP